MNKLKYYIVIILLSSFLTIQSYAEKLPADNASLQVPEEARVEDFSIAAEELTGRQINRIDTLFIYSPEVLEKAGSLTNLQKKVDLIVEKANLILVNSKIRLRVRSVNLVASPVGESDQARTALQNINASEAVKTLRTENNADIVSFLISHTSNNQHCGMAYQLEGMNQYSSIYGHQVISLNDLCPNWVFTHELGHNLGANHDRENSPTPGLFSNSYGMRINVGSLTYRTVMAFEPGSIISYFSNPAIKYNNVSIGNVDTDNSGTLELSRNFVAGYLGESSVEILPKVTLKKLLAPRSCQVTATLKDFLPETKVEFYSRVKDQVKLLKSKVISDSVLRLNVKRGKKVKFIKAVITDSVGEIPTLEIKCKPIKK